MIKKKSGKKSYLRDRYDPCFFRGYPTSSKWSITQFGDTPNNAPTLFKVAPDFAYSCIRSAGSIFLITQIECALLWHARQRIIKFSRKLSSRSLFLWWTSTLPTLPHLSHLCGKFNVSKAIARAIIPWIAWRDFGLRPICATSITNLFVKNGDKTIFVFWRGT